MTRRTAAPALTLAGGSWWHGGALDRVTLFVERGLVAAGEGAGERKQADLAGRVILPGLVNAHDHLDFSTYPALGRPPYANAYAWIAEMESGPPSAALTAALAVPLPDRLFLGGLRNLLAGVTAVAHHNPYHRALGRPDFPVRVLERYHFAHSPGLTPALRRTYRTTDRRIPWLVHAAEGTDERSRAELDLLAEQNVLRQNTLVVHGIALGEPDARRMAAARACLVWCPEANRRLYGATAAVAAMRAAGVRIGLGSDSPAAGVRDPLSNLAAARAEAVLTDAELIDLATRGSAEVARLPLGGVEAGQPADFVVVDSIEGLLAGDRRAVALVLVRGRALYGEPALLEALGVKWGPITVDGAARGMEASLAERAAGLTRRHPAVASVPWLRGIAFSA
jgi:cytosine/adenosine deaminase-related metal-dependent hydrolase